MVENTPTLHTQRLILRQFTPQDVAAYFALMTDEKTNTFVPWFPPKTVEEAARGLEGYLNSYEKPAGYHYAICLETDDIPIGYVNVGDGESRDFGYGLRSEFWHQGIVTEACEAVVERVRTAGIAFLTATHDVDNPRSGAVMKKLGMRYCYSYEEQWKPKNFPVIFRMYQLNLDGAAERVYRKYWDDATVRFVEENVWKKESATDSCAIVGGCFPPAVV